MLFLIIFCFFSFVSPIDIKIETNEIISEVSQKSLSVALDSHIVAENWKNFDFNSKSVLSMAKALSPAYLRQVAVSNFETKNYFLQHLKASLNLTKYFIKIL